MLPLGLSKLSAALSTAGKTKESPQVHCFGFMAKIVLENNVFEFDGEMYRQKSGTARGSNRNEQQK